MQTVHCVCCALQLVAAQCMGRKVRLPGECAAMQDVGARTHGERECNGREGRERAREERDQTDKHCLLLQDVRGRREREEVVRHRGRMSLSQGDQMGLPRKEGLHKMRMGVGQGLAGQPIPEQMLRIACQPRRSL